MNVQEIASCQQIHGVAFTDHNLHERTSHNPVGEEGMEVGTRNQEKHIKGRHRLPLHVERQRGAKGRRKLCQQDLATPVESEAEQHVCHLLYLMHTRGRKTNWLDMTAHFNRIVKCTARSNPLVDINPTRL